jgi:hypothetical protein
MIRRVALATAAAAAIAAYAVPASAQSRVEVGVLTCRVAPSVGFVVASVRDMRCSFRPNRGGRPQAYNGRATRIGLDVGITAEGILVWAVYAPTTRIGRGDLVGDYVGASGAIGVGAGVGANALVGGSRRTIALQPVSVEASVGVNLALGVANLSLR